MNIVIIDYDIGNVKSIINSLENVNIKPILSKDKKEIMNADGIILPGVGAFKHGMRNLREYNLDKIILEYVKLNKPLLGICLGMQILLEESTEFGITKGLGLIKGKIEKFPFDKSNYEKLPHVSWNEIESKSISWNQTILDSIEEKSDMYFVHSYIAMPDDDKNILSTTMYANYNFVSSVKEGNIYGCQFHPEKSGKLGLKIISNFVKVCEEKKNGKKT